MKREHFDVSGMSCSACSARVERCVSAIDGVFEVSVNLLKNTMSVTYDEGITDADFITDTVKKAGYGASVKKYASQSYNKPSGGEYESLKKRVIISAAFAIPLFYIAMGHMMGWPLPSLLLGTQNALAFAIIQLVLLTPILIVNYKYYKNGFSSLFRGGANMDSLIAIGSSSAVIYGLYAIFKIAIGIHTMDYESVHHFMMNLYFESAGMILTLITLGKTFEMRAKRRTSDAITRLMDLAPKTAVVQRDGYEETVPIDEVAVGDTLIVKAGESVPADGVIISGFATVDESALTGESIPCEKSISDAVIGATTCRYGYFKMRVERIGEDTALSQIVKLVDQATASKAPIAKLADKISGVFVPSVIVISLITAIAWLISGAGIEFALSTAISVLVISCPCALGLATPTAIMVGMGKGASLGILIKSAEALQCAHDINVVVFDKTGTLTCGEPEVTDVYTEAGFDEKKLIEIAACAEKPSEHPLSLAVVRKAESLGIHIREAEDFLQIPGGGIRATLDGVEILGGNRKLMEQNGIKSELFAKGDEIAASGKTPLYFSFDQNIIGLISVADRVKSGSRDAVKELREMGIGVVMLTGDNSKTAAAIATEVGIDSYISEVYPEDKEKEIFRLQQSGKRVAMVGDGINDAPALARADVGIAIGAGTDIAIESADVVLMKNELSDVPRAIKLSRAVMRTIKQNLFWAFIYNAIGIPIAAGLFYVPFGLNLTPMIAGAAMSLSSIFVVTNALRLKCEPHSATLRVTEGR